MAIFARKRPTVQACGGGQHKRRRRGGAHFLQWVWKVDHFSSDLEKCHFVGGEARARDEERRAEEESVNESM